MEYQLAAILKKYNLQVDEERVEFIHEAARFLCSLPSAVQREIYGHRAAEMGKISYEAMKIEVNKAYKQRQKKAEKQQEKIDLAPARKLQPKSRDIRYDNIKSAMAEEMVLAMVMKEPALFEKVGQLSEDKFSVSLLGKAFAQLQEYYRQGREAGCHTLVDFSTEEMSHLVGILHRHERPVNEAEFADCIATILSEHQVQNISSDDDLLALQKKLREKKGTV